MSFASLKSVKLYKWNFFPACVNVGKVFCNLLREADNICVFTANIVRLWVPSEWLECGLWINTPINFQDFHTGHFTRSFGSLTQYVYHYLVPQLSSDETVLEFILK